jgi:hypothetical protein
MGKRHTLRDQAEAFDALGLGIAALMADFDRVVTDPDMIDRLNAIKGAEFIDSISTACRKVALEIEREADAAEDAEFERLANPLEPGFRRVA